MQPASSPAATESLSGFTPLSSDQRFGNELFSSMQHLTKLFLWKEDAASLLYQLNESIRIRVVVLMKLFMCLSWKFNFSVYNLRLTAPGAHSLISRRA